MARLRFLTAGESHGKCLSAIIEGMPSGIPLDEGEMNHDMARRQMGYGRGGRMKIEHDTMEIVSGVRFGETIGGPITIIVKNRDHGNWGAKMATFGEPPDDLARVTAARPGHADLAGIEKYDRSDIRDILERSSARETAMRVAVGAVAKQFLSRCGITVASHVTNIGGVSIDRAKVKVSDINGTSSELNCYDKDAEERMKEKIRAAKEAGDTLGGVFEVVARGVPVGLGSHAEYDRRLDARLAGAMMSIQAIKGVEIGDGFLYADMLGSEAHDEIYYEDGRVTRRTNHAGGIEGGMSNGETLVVRAAMKPIPTLMQPLHSIDVATRELVLASKERSDVCAVSAASVVGEAMTAFVIADALLEKFGGDTLGDVLSSIASYKERLKRNGFK